MGRRFERRRRGGWLALAWLVCAYASISPSLAAKPARAEPAECPEPPAMIPRGLTLRSSVGPAIWFGEVGRNSRPGLAFTFAAAWELFSWLAVEASWTSGLNGTDQPHPPARGTFTTHALHGGLKLGFRLGRFDLFLRAAAGMQRASPDILVRVERFDGRVRLAWLGGLGFVWHTPRRHFWIGLEVDTLGAIDFPGLLVIPSGVIGFTL